MEYRWVWVASAPPVLFAALAALPAVLNGWRPWEVVGLVAVLAAAGAAAAWAWAWYATRVRAIELAALSSDEQAARLLGEALGRCDNFLDADAAREVWAAFNAAPSRAKRAMTLAVLGFLAQGDVVETHDFPEKLVALARSFLGPAGPPAPAPPAPAAPAPHSQPVAAQ